MLLDLDYHAAFDRTKQMIRLNERGLYSSADYLRIEKDSDLFPCGRRQMLWCSLIATRETIGKKIPDMGKDTKLYVDVVRSFVRVAFGSSKNGHSHKTTFSPTSRKVKRRVVCSKTTNVTKRSQQTRWSYTFERDQKEDKGILHNNL